MDFNDPEVAAGAVRNIPCPHCGRVHSVTPVTVLRPGDSALEKLFCGRLNVIHCPDCDRRFTLDVPLLYRDDPRRTLIYCLVMDDRSRWRETEAQMRELMARLFEGAAPGETPRLRLTLSRREFIEKIALHSKELDDRIVEFLKFQLFRRKEEQVNPEKFELLYDFSADDAEKLVLLLFERRTGKPGGAVHYPIEVYRELAELFNGEEDWRKELELLFPSYYVNVDRLLFE